MWRRVGLGWAVAAEGRVRLAVWGSVGVESGPVGAVSEPRWAGPSRVGRGHEREGLAWGGRGRERVESGSVGGGVSTGRGPAGRGSGRYQSQALATRERGWVEP